MLHQPGNPVPTAAAMSSELNVVARIPIVVWPGFYKTPDGHLVARILIVVWPGFRKPQMAIGAALQGRGLPAL